MHFTLQRPLQGSTATVEQSNSSTILVLSKTNVVFLMYARLKAVNDEHNKMRAFNLDSISSTILPFAMFQPSTPTPARRRRHLESLLSKEQSSTSTEGMEEEQPLARAIAGTNRHPSSVLISFTRSQNQTRQNKDRIMHVCRHVHMQQETWYPHECQDAARAREIRKMPHIHC